MWKEKKFFQYTIQTSMAFLHLLDCCWKKNQNNSTSHEFLPMRTRTLGAYIMAISMNIISMRKKWYFFFELLKVWCRCISRLRESRTQVQWASDTQTDFSLSPKLHVMFCFDFFFFSHMHSGRIFQKHVFFADFPSEGYSLNRFCHHLVSCI